MYKNIIADAAPRCKPSTRPKPQPPLWQNAGNRPGAAQTPTGGPWPSPTNRGQRPANRDGCQPYGAATHVGDDACIVPGDPAAAPTSPGGINPAPTAHGERPANRDGRGHPGKRRAGCPHPAGPCGSANTLPHPGAAFQGGAIPPSRPAAVPPPFDKGGKSAAKLRPAGQAAALCDRNPCRGRCLHRPGRPCGGANVPGRDKSRPYGPRRTPGQPGRPRPPGQT